MPNQFARKNMTQSDYRDEQFFVRDWLAEKYPDLIIKSEYRIDKLTLEGKPWRGCVLDIAIPSKKIAIRLNGGYHFNSTKQRSRDDFQLEALKEGGWTVFDLDHYKMGCLFKKKKNDETIKCAKLELEKHLGQMSSL